jgi:hypothetical protein
MELSTRRHYGHASRTEGAAEADVRCRRDRGRARKLAGAYSPFPHPSFCLAVSRRSSLVVMEGNGDGDRGAQDQGGHLGAQHGARRRSTRRTRTSRPQRRRRQPAPHRARSRALCDVVKITTTTIVGGQSWSLGSLDLLNAIVGVADSRRRTALDMARSATS